MSGSNPGTPSGCQSTDSVGQEEPTPPTTPTSCDKEDILRKKREQKDLSKLVGAKQVSVRIIRNKFKQKPKISVDNKCSETEQNSNTNQDHIMEQQVTLIHSGDPMDTTSLPDVAGLGSTEDSSTVLGDVSHNDSGIGLDELPKDLEESAILSQTELTEIKNIEEALMSTSNESKGDDEDSLEDLPEISQQTVDEIVNMLPGHDDPLTPPPALPVHSSSIVSSEPLQTPTLSVLSTADEDDTALVHKLNSIQEEGLQPVLPTPCLDEPIEECSEEHILTDLSGPVKENKASEQSDSNNAVTHPLTENSKNHPSQEPVATVVEQQQTETQPSVEQELPAVADNDPTPNYQPSN